MFTISLSPNNGVSNRNAIADANLYQDRLAQAKVSLTGFDTIEAAREMRDEISRAHPLPDTLKLIVIGKPVKLPMF